MNRQIGNFLIVDFAVQFLFHKLLHFFRDFIGLGIFFYYHIIKRAFHPQSLLSVQPLYKKFDVGDQPLVIQIFFIQLGSGQII